MVGHRQGAFLGAVVSAQVATAVFWSAALCTGVTTAWAASRHEKRDALWSAVRAGDIKTIQAALDKGADVNAKNEMGVSALWIACSKGKFDVIQYLVKHGADVNIRDGIWYGTPLGISAEDRKLEASQLLIKSGAKGVDDALFAVARGGHRKMVEMILKEGKVSQQGVDAALYVVGKNAKLQEVLTKAGAKPLPPADKRDREKWAKVAGTYEADGGGKLTIALKDVGLVSAGRWLRPTGPDTFVPLASTGMQIRVERRGNEG